MALTGDAGAAVFLSQLLYWTMRGPGVEQRDGWIDKTARDWEHETGMSWKVQHRARAILLRLRLIEERHVAMPARLEYRVVVDKLGAALSARDPARHDPTVASDAGARDGSERLDLAGLRRADRAAIDRLFGPAFLFHRVLARRWPLHTVALASRLLAACAGRYESGGAMGSTPRGAAPALHWVSMHRDEWLRQTGLSRDQWQTARGRLDEAGVLVERQMNFPRRVALAIDAAALERLLDSAFFDEERSEAAPARPRHRPPCRGSAADTGKPGAAAQPHQAYSASTPRSYGQDRAKQPTLALLHPIPPTASPDPTFTDRPNPPSIPKTQENFNTHPKTGGRATAPAASPEAAFTSRVPMVPTFGWGGGWSYAAQRLETWPAATSPRYPVATAGAVRPPVEPSRIAGRSGLRAQPAPPVDDGLFWPEQLSEGDRRHAGAHFAGLGHEVRQAILDELAWYHVRGVVVHSPVALLRTLARRASEGRFIPDGAHRVAQRREQRPRAPAGSGHGLSVDRSLTGARQGSGSDDPDKPQRAGLGTAPWVLSEAARTNLARLRAWRATVGTAAPVCGTSGWRDEAGRDEAGRAAAVLDSPTNASLYDHGTTLAARTRRAEPAACMADCT